jgi:transporter family-2 protein
MTILWYVLALAVGLAIAVQAPLNGQAANAVGVGPLLIISNIVVLVGSIPVYYLWPETARWGAVSGVPLLHWGGSLCGLTIVVGGMLVFPRLGPTTALGLILIGQFALALLLERQGWLGIPKAPLEPAKLIGVALMLLGFAVTQSKNLAKSFAATTQETDAKAPEASKGTAASIPTPPPSMPASVH